MMHSGVALSRGTVRRVGRLRDARQQRTCTIATKTFLRGRLLCSGHTTCTHHDSLARSLYLSLSAVAADLERPSQTHHVVAGRVCSARCRTTAQEERDPQCRRTCAPQDACCSSKASPLCFSPNRGSGWSHTRRVRNVSKRFPVRFSDAVARGICNNRRRRRRLRTTRSEKTYIITCFLRHIHCLHYYRFSFLFFFLLLSFFVRGDVRC